MVTNGKKNGRPRKEIDFKEFENLCFLQCSLVEIAAWFRCSEGLIETRVKEHYGEGFQECFAKKRVGGLMSVRRNLFKLSEYNVAAAIFLAKNLLGMTDNWHMEHTGKGGGPIQYQELTDAQLHVIAAQGIVNHARRGRNGAPKEANGTG